MKRRLFRTGQGFCANCGIPPHERPIEKAEPQLI